MVRRGDIMDDSKAIWLEEWLQKWGGVRKVSLTLVVAAGVWLLMPTISSYHGTDLVTHRVGIGVGWGEWLILALTTGEALNGPEYRLELVAGPLILAPLALLLAAWLLHRFADQLATPWSLPTKLNAALQALPSALLTGIVVAMILAILLPQPVQYRLAPQHGHDARQLVNEISAILAERPGRHLISVDDTANADALILVDTHRFLPGYLMNSHDSWDMSELPGTWIQGMQMHTNTLVMPLGLLVALALLFHKVSRIPSSNRSSPG